MWYGVTCGMIREMIVKYGINDGEIDIVHTECDNMII
jgi:hypothetical protein